MTVEVLENATPAAHETRNPDIGYRRANGSKGTYWTTDPDQALPVRVGDAYPANLPARTVMETLKATVIRHPQKVAYRFTKDGEEKSVTWLKYHKDVTKFAKACIHLNVNPHSGVAIQGFNSYEWVVANVGAIFARTIATGVYTTNQVAASKHVAHLCHAEVVVVESEKHLQKYLSEEKGGALEGVKAYVVWGELENDWKGHEPPVYSWKKFLRLGKKVDDSELDKRAEPQKPGHCCTVITTSGTTGLPKGVMLSHDNLTWTAQVVGELFDLTEEDRSISYLPLSHIAAQMLDIYAPMVSGSQVTFATPDALKGKLIDTLREVRPTVFLGVPRVWTKVQEGMQAKAANVRGIKRAIGRWAKRKGLEAARREAEGLPPPKGYKLADKLVFSKVRDALGLDQCRLTLTGAAPIPEETLTYFQSLNFQLLDLYGASESSGPETISMPGAYKKGTTGRPFPGTEVTILKENEEDEDGEILMRGRHIFMGYIDNAEKTRATIDRYGYLHSGDIGKLDEDNFLKITGRKKELLITEGGENVAPVPIEQHLKEELPSVSQLMLIGDGRKYLTCLMTLRTKTGEDGEWTNELADDLQKLFSDLAGREINTTDDARECAEVIQHLEKGVTQYNLDAESRAKRVQYFTVLAEDFTVENGLLTPTQKLKRPIVMERYAEEIEAMYNK